MKKFLAVIGCLILSMGLVACGDKEPEQPSQEVTVVKQDCFEFDINTQQFTDKILLSINLTNAFEVNENLLFQDPTYYIGDFKKRNESGEVERTIQVYEYNDSEFNINNDSSKVSANWSIANENLDSESAYIRTFYCSKDGYVIAIDIVNNTKEPLSIDDSLALLTFLTGEDSHQPVVEAEKRVTSEATIDSPARTGEWVSTTVFNRTTNTYEPVCICIDEIYTGEIAQEIVTDYNNTMSVDPDASYNFIPYFVSDPSAFEYVAFEYSIFFPSTFTMNKNGNADIVVPFDISNLKDNGKGIDGYINLDKTLVDISPVISANPGSIWYDGLGFFEMSIDFDAYYIKVTSDNKLSDTKYIRP